MNEDTFAHITRLMQDSAPLVASAWSHNRPQLAAAYEKRMNSFLENRSRFPTRWQEETLLFVPFAELAESRVREMTMQTSQMLIAQEFDVETLRRSIGDKMRDISPHFDLWNTCGICVSSLFENWIRQLLARTIKDGCDKVDIRAKLVLAHWVMIRGGFRRWSENIPYRILRNWGEETVVAILVDRGEGLGQSMKTLRLAFEKDLKSAHECIAAYQAKLNKVPPSSLSEA